MSRLMDHRRGWECFCPEYQEKRIRSFYDKSNLIFWSLNDAKSNP